MLLPPPPPPCPPLPGPSPKSYTSGSPLNGPSPGTSYIGSSSGHPSILPLTGYSTGHALPLSPSSHVTGNSTALRPIGYDLYSGPERVASAMPYHLPRASRNRSPWPTVWKYSAEPRFVRIGLRGYGVYGPVRFLERAMVIAWSITVPPSAMSR